jgi:hypothetical protein
LNNNKTRDISMKRIIIISGILLTGCANLLTKDNVKYASNRGLCDIAAGYGFASEETKAIASDELIRRGTFNDCIEQPRAVSSSSNADTNAALMQWGSQMMQQSQPRALIATPPAPPAPTRTNCVTYANGMTSCNTW